jgi:hypothetical protein
MASSLSLDLPTLGAQGGALCFDVRNDVIVSLALSRNISRVLR